MTRRDGPVVACVVGARPNFMKIKPVMDALGGRTVTTCLVHTGQHYDASMSQVFFDDLGLRPPDVHLGVGPGTRAEQISGVLIAMEQLLSQRNPDAVVVVGDVNSTVGAALSAATAPTLLAHVEAGMRCGDRSMPEEMNRIVTDRVSDLLLAPSPDAVANLRAEGHPAESIELVGDVMAETLHRFLPSAANRPVLQRFGLSPRNYVVATMHRPGNVDDPDRLADLLGTLDQLAADIPVVLPLHPRTRRRMVEHRLPDTKAVKVTEPLGYLDFVGLQARARFVLTDSGSVQEEARSLGLPCLTLRDTTERWDTLRDGSNQLVGTDRNTILSAARALLAEQRERVRPEPVRSVGERIVAALMKRIG